jgi:hypothetical protein
MASRIVSTHFVISQTLSGNEAGIVTQNRSIAVLGSSAIAGTQRLRLAMQPEFDLADRSN